MAKHPRIVVFFVLATAFFVHVPTSAASMTGSFEVSTTSLPRHNQVGETAHLSSSTLAFSIGDWQIGATLAFDQRRQAVPGYRRLFPLHVRMENEGTHYFVGYDHLPNWGYGRTGALVLSRDVPPLMYAHYGVKGGSVAYEKLVGSLDFGPKYLFAHRILVRPHPSLELTASEVSIVSEKVAAHPLNYLPGWPLYLSQHLKLGGFGNDDLNANMSVGGRWASPWGLLYGEIFVDDMPQDPSHRDAYLIAGQAGFVRPVRFAGRTAALGIEYTRANNWTYTFRDLPYHYTHHGYVLGHWIGPDSDLLDLTLAFPWTLPKGESAASSPVDVEVSYQLRRRGEGKLGDDWEEHGTEDARAHSFLTGVVETTHTIGVAVDWQYSDSLGLTVKVGAGPSFNQDNVDGARGIDSSVSARLRYAW